MSHTHIQRPANLKCKLEVEQLESLAIETLKQVKQIDMGGVFLVVSL